jgi:hypothetical protein
MLLLTGVTQNDGGKREQNAFLPSLFNFHFPHSSLLDQPEKKWLVQLFITCSFL